jgi:hypothetical protein
MKTSIGSFDSGDMVTVVYILPQLDRRAMVKPGTAYGLSCFVTSVHLLSGCRAFSMQSDTCWGALVVVFPFFMTIGFGNAGKKQAEEGKDNEGKGDYQGDILAVSAGAFLPGYDCWKILHVPVDEIG